MTEKNSKTKNENVSRNDEVVATIQVLKGKNKVKKIKVLKEQGGRI